MTVLKLKDKAPLKGFHNNMTAKSKDNHWGGFQACW